LICLPPKKQIAASNFSASIDWTSLARIFGNLDLFKDVGPVKTLRLLYLRIWTVKNQQ